MPYSEDLEIRIRQILCEEEVTFKKMFGGLCIIHRGNMVCGIVGEQLMGRVPKESYETHLEHPMVREMDFTGKAMRGMIYIDPDGIRKPKDLEHWVFLCLEYIKTLPPKTKK